MSIKDDKELVELTTKDPEKGFRYLMTKYKEVVYWHIRRLVVAHEDAQDATQETFVRVFRSLSDFKGECTFRSWVYRIATNEPYVCLGNIKKKNWCHWMTLTAN